MIQHQNRVSVQKLLPFLLLLAAPVAAEDIDGIVEHPMISRYPGQEIRWQHIENYMPYRVPLGPVTGYRKIDDWIDTAGQVTRTFYRYEGSDRTFSEIYLNYLESLRAEGFEILAEGLTPDRRGAGIASRQWAEVLFRENPATKPGEVGTMFSGTSSSGGAGAIVGRRERAAGTAYVVINVEQHSAAYVGSLIDIIEVEAAETGLVAIDAEAIGTGIREYGRVVLDGIFFDHDQATLKPESSDALAAIARFLAVEPTKQYYVVGHTDSVGTFAHNRKLSEDRARAVVDALRLDYDVAPERIEPFGVGPLVPAFANASDEGRARNRRVELVEK